MDHRSYSSHPARPRDTRGPLVGLMDQRGFGSSILSNHNHNNINNEIKNGNVHDDGPGGSQAMHRGEIRQRGIQPGRQGGTGSSGPIRASISSSLKDLVLSLDQESEPRTPTRGPGRLDGLGLPRLPDLGRIKPRSGVGVRPPVSAQAAVPAQSRQCQQQQQIHTRRQTTLPPTIQPRQLPLPQITEDEESARRSPIFFKFDEDDFDYEHHGRPAHSTPSYPPRSHASSVPVDRIVEVAMDGKKTMAGSGTGSVPTMGSLFQDENRSLTIEFLTENDEYEQRLEGWVLSAFNEQGIRVPPKANWLTEASTVYNNRIKKNSYTLVQGKKQCHHCRRIDWNTRRKYPWVQCLRPDHSDHSTTASRCTQCLLHGRSCVFDDDAEEEEKEEAVVAATGPTVKTQQIIIEQLQANAVEMNRKMGEMDEQMKRMDERLKKVVTVLQRSS